MNCAEIRKKCGRPSKRIPESTLAELYVKHTATEIADMYGVSTNSVRHWLYEYRKQHKND